MYMYIYNKLNKFTLKLLNVQSSRAGDERGTGKIKKKKCLMCRNLKSTRNVQCGG